ncbi:MAG: LGFP repeat-containing protein, partial [Microbacteriaceae bacterium]
MKQTQQKQRSGNLPRFFTGFIGLLVSLMLVVHTPVQASAVNAQDFDPGLIITDDNFYQGSAMTVSEVQAFLDSAIRGGKCIIGQKGSKPGDPSADGSGFASACLNRYRQTTTSEPANQYCKAYVGASNETAAAIITKVGKACGISQRVLITMLEKEQSLITDEWPTVLQYSRAMGYACPDSGPGNSANCDTNFYGFFNQVYSAAWQFQRYKHNPNGYAYKPKQTNTIQWHPNVSCGTSRVYIQNAATAALYIYTPYRPNAAALNAQFGTGNSCSSYGNRNFFLLYSLWFGDPVTPSVIQDAHRAAGGESGPLGKALKPVEKYANGGLGQLFQGGSIYYSPSTGAHVIAEPIRGAYRTAGYQNGALGYPTKPVEKYAKGGLGQLFQGGSIYYSPSTG